MLAEYSDVVFAGPPGAYNSTPYPKRYIAIHNTSNTASDTAEASYAQHRADHISSHYYVDGDSITQSLRTEFGANHAGSTIGNRHAIAYEITGANAKTRTWWLSNVAWSLLARQVARDCRKHNITPRLLTVEQMLDGTTAGIVTHDQMRRAWGGTTHTDPGPGFPLDHLLALVAAEMEDDMPLSPEDRVAIWTHDLADGPAVDPAYKVLNRAAMDAAATRSAVAALDAKVSKLAAPPVVVDPAALKAVLLDPAVLAAIAKANADEDHRRSAE